MAIKNRPSEETLIDMYENKLMGILPISKQLGVSYGTARKWLLEAGIALRNRSFRKYPIESILKFLDTPSPELWYFLGYFFADGCLSSKNYNCGLSSVDTYHLVRIAQVIGYAGQPRHTGKNVYSLTIYSKAVHDTLMGFGLTPRKSLTIQWPPGIPEWFLGDFIRGYFDGDGSVTLRNLRSCPPSIGVRFTSGSKPFLESLRSILAPRNIPARVFTPEGRASELEISHRDACLALVKLMYGSNPTLYMERKWRRFAMFLAWHGLVRPNLVASLAVGHLPKSGGI